MTDPALIGAVQRFYDAVARRSPDHAFLNYGFDDFDQAARHASEGDLVSACRRLYETILMPFPVDIGQIVEVGCGRGGGAEFLLQSRPGLRYLGIDLSPEHLALCRTRFASRPGTGFVLADAAYLPARDGRFDAAFSIEAAQHFAEPNRFYHEVARLLRPGGWFLVASLWQPSQEPTDVFRDAGFRVVERRDITANVVASLSRTSGLREQLVDSLSLPERFRPLLLSWAGVRGTASFDCLATGALLYVTYRMVRE
jgi:ubiquinone/menaquinone biosynthesis C-methylase UbiE